MAHIATVRKLAASLGFRVVKEEDSAKTYGYCCYWLEFDADRLLYTIAAMSADGCFTTLEGFKGKDRPAIIAELKKMMVAERQYAFKTVAVEVNPNYSEPEQTAQAEEAPVVAATVMEPTSGLVMKTIDDITDALMTHFDGLTREQIKADMERKGSYCWLLKRLLKRYTRARKAAENFGYIGVGAISFAEARLVEFQKKAGIVLIPEDHADLTALNQHAAACFQDSPEDARERRAAAQAHKRWRRSYEIQARKGAFQPYGIAGLCTPTGWERLK